MIAVRDSGPGIAPAELPHVFDRYWTGRTKKGGAGLGLAIAKGIVVGARRRDRGRQHSRARARGSRSRCPSRLPPRVDTPTVRC